MMKSIYTHFRKEEHAFVDQVLDWKAQVELYYQPKRTDFLDPREQVIVASLIGNNGEVNVSFFGGSDHAERKRAYIYPMYMEPVPEDFGLKALELAYATKFHSITHPQVLGSLMGAGLKRQKYGDILIEDKVVQIIIAEEVASFVQMNFQSVGKTPVELNEIPLTSLKQIASEWHEKHGTVASFRLDAILGEIFQLSRQKSQMLIQAGYVKVNHKIIEKTAYECISGDLLSARGYGRAKILSIEGRTKKDKWRLSYGVQKT